MVLALRQVSSSSYSRESYLPALGLLLLVDSVVTLHPLLEIAKNFYVLEKEYWTISYPNPHPGFPHYTLFKLKCNLYPLKFVNVKCIVGEFCKFYTFPSPQNVPI